MMYFWLDRFCISPTDPEGIVSTFSFLFICYVAVEFARAPLTAPPKSLLKRAFIFATPLFALVALHPLVPINKKIASLTFVALTSASATLLLALLCLLPDAPWARRTFAPALWLGRNPLLVFVGMIALEILLMDNVRFPRDGGFVSLWAFLFDNSLGLVQPRAVGSSLFACAHLLLWAAVAYACDRKGFHWRL
jgi:predicted acyltransferase